MSDLIERSAAKQHIRTALHADMDLLSAEFANAICNVLDGVPTVDAVPVVRCKHCKHKYMKDKVWHCVFGLPSGADGFCSYGERREGVEHE